MWTFWYIREASTAIFVANMPMCWSLMRRLFNLHAFNHNSTTSKDGTDLKTIGSRRIPGRAVYGAGTQDSEPRNRSKGTTDTSWWEREGMPRTESEEFIVEQPPSGSRDAPLEIWESKEFDVVNDRNSIAVDNNLQVQQDVMFDGGHRTQTVVSARKSEDNRRR
jgi:hypothetical protein